jgi:hypothetical protein
VVEYVLYQAAPTWIINSIVVPYIFSKSSHGRYSDLRTHTEGSESWFRISRDIKTYQDVQSKSWEIDFELSLSLPHEEPIRLDGILTHAFFETLGTYLLLVLDFNENPSAAQQAMTDPLMRSKIERLIASGIIERG